MRRLFLIVMLFLSVFANALSLEHVRFDQLDNRDGLSSQNITAIYEDQNGYYWFGTREGGLNRFNGNTFTTFAQNSSGTGLTNNYITSIAEDKNGLIWIGTLGGGINYYDPNTMRYGSIDSILNIISFLPSRFIHCLYFDSSDNLWIGSIDGLTKYSMERQSFVSYHHDPNASISLISNKVHKVIELSDGVILVGSELGLDRLDLNQGISANLLSGFEVRSLLKDSVSGDVWIGTSTGLFVLEHETSTSATQSDGRENSVKFFRDNYLNSLQADKNYTQLKKVRIPEIQSQDITALQIDDQQNIWVGTANNGAGLINQQLEILGWFLPEAGSRQSLSDRAVNEILVDRSSTVWIGTKIGGINVYNPFNIPFYPLSHYKENITNLASLNFTFLDSNDQVWFATREGLHLFNRPKNTYRVFNLPENDNFLCVAELADGSLVTGTYGSGVFFFDPKTGQFSKKGFAKLAAIADQKVWFILDDKQGSIWLGTIGNGIFRINTTTLAVDHFVHDENNPNTLANNFIKQIVQDQQGFIWVISNHQGVARFDPTNNNFIRYAHNESDPNSLPDNSVDDIYAAKSGELFFSTFDGLCRFDYNSGVFMQINLPAGKNSAVTKGLLTHKSNEWWIANKDGLIRYNPQTEESWVINDIGIHLGELKRSSLNQFKDGTIIVSCTNEIILFDPEKIIKNPIKPKLALTDLFVNHELVSEFGENSVLQRPLYLTNKIVLEHQQRNFNIGFTCMNVFASGDVQFVYMLEGYDHNWVNTSTNMNATYTNLDPGDYTFKVKAVNIDGAWSDEDISLEIKILPLWYNTWYFRIILVSLLILMVASGVQYRIISLKKQRLALKKKVEEKTKELHLINEELQEQKLALINSQETIVRKNEQLEQANLLLLERNKEILEKNEKLEDLGQTKNRFFANISHEFKTPLTLILGPLENLMDRLKGDPDYLGYIEMIGKNSRRLLGLINQLLDISKIESGKMSLSLVHDDILEFTRSIFNSFNYRAQRLNISYRFLFESDQLKVFFDPDKVEKILFNILSNAFKFTPQNGHIEVLVNNYHDHKTGWQYALISVSDNGIGISESNLTRVFDYFNQISQSKTGVQSSGIGLSLVKQMAEIHQGDVQIFSEVNKGTRVMVKIRVDKGIVENNLLQSEFTPSENLHQNLQAESKQDMPAIEIEEQYLIDEEAPYVLIIEDNPDILLYVKDILKDKFNVLATTEGFKGFDLALDMIPDLIICDVMLPDANGIDICKKIKENEITNHIPIIVLTAMDGEENVQKGFETGVDNYITKPFNPQLLKLRVQNLINTRKNLIEKHKINFLSTELNVLRLRKNEDFVEKLVSIIEDNIEDSDLSNDSIASQLNVSKRQLYRKLEGVLSMPLNKFIRHIKMKKAMEIMQSVPDLTISEVAYQVGFNNPKYFSKCFKEEFGSLPSELLKTTGLE